MIDRSHQTLEAYTAMASASSKSSSSEDFINTAFTRVTQANGGLERGVAFVEDSSESHVFHPV